MRFIELLSEDEEIAYQPSGADGVVYVRRLTLDIRNEIHRRYQKIDTRHGRRETYIPDHHLVDMEKDLWDYIVIRWDGVAAKKGSLEPAPCTRDTKYHLPDRIRQEILALVDEANVSGLRNGANAPVDPTRA